MTKELSAGVKKYFDIIDSEVSRAYDFANKAKSSGVDIDDRVDIILAKNLFERVVGLVKVVAPRLDEGRVVGRLIELEKEYGSQDWRVAFKISYEAAIQSFCKFKDEREAIEVGLRLGMAYITVGVVASPLEGFVKLKFKKRRDNEKEYFSLFFSGPIRSAGTTAICVFVALADYVRKRMGYVEYDPSDDEINRAVTELYDFHERITNLQYLPSEDELKFFVKSLPVEIDGDPSEKFEVSNYKNLPRIETNKLRNGFCLVWGEGLTQKGAKFNGKFIKWRDDFDMSHWKFLDAFVKLQKNIRSKGKVKEEKNVKVMADFNYIKDLVAGRPILGYPMEIGGFRLRYGRARNSGFSSCAIHPATMVVLNKYIAIGTQLKMERPGKATTLAQCDSIEGPIVKLTNGVVLFLDSYEKAVKYSDDVEEILFLGDILICYGDFLNRAHVLVPPGYCEEMWICEVERSMKEKGYTKKNLGIEEDLDNCEFDQAIVVSNKLDVPMHPRYTYHWGEISKKNFLSLVCWLEKAVIKKDKVIFPLVYDVGVHIEREDPKRVLELLGVPHLVVGVEYVVIEKDDAKAFAASLGFYSNELNEGLIREAFNNFDSVLEIVNSVSEVKIKDKGGLYIGARMGRPEKAKIRKLASSPHVLFPVGEEGGRLRSFQSALEKGEVMSHFPMYFCEECKEKTIYSGCDRCGCKTKQLFYCIQCKKEMFEDKCASHGDNLSYKLQRINVKRYYDGALKVLELRKFPELVKGIRGTSNLGHVPENLIKGILRAIHNIHVNKDGTIRYDMTEMGITHFKPKEIGTSVKRLIDLGYRKDIYGMALVGDDQILELKIQDVILPSCDESLEAGADEILFRVGNFIDDLLVKFYKVKPFYNFKTKRDVVGCLIIGMSPHTSAGIVGRVIGFSKTQGFFAHPVFHSIMRRDCLGYDNYVAIEEKGNWNIRKIGEFIDKHNPIDLADNFGTCKKKMQNSFVWSNPTKGKIKEITKHTKTKMLRLSLEDGRKITLTDSHKVYIKGKKVKRAFQLEIGNKLMVNYKKDIPEKDIKTIFLPEIFCGRADIMLRGIRDYLNVFKKISRHENFWQRDSFPIILVEDILKKHGKSLCDLPKKTRMAIKRDNISMPIEIPMDLALLEILGLYLAEGCTRKNTSKKGFFQINISSADDELKCYVEKVFFSYFNLKPTERHEDHVTFSSRILYELFTDYFKLGSGAKNKRIPSMFLNLKKEKLAAFLRGYFEGDGSVSRTDIRVTCDTISEGLKQDLSFVLSRFNIFTKFYEYEKEPGRQVRTFYIRKNRPIPKFRITKIIIPSNFVKNFEMIGFISQRKRKNLSELCRRMPRGMKIEFDDKYVYPKIRDIEEIGEDISYCFNVLEEHNFFANDILVHNCDGDEAGVMLLMDAFLNFSKKLLGAHRGARQDEPIVLTSRLIPAEVDDMVFDMDIAWSYPLEFYGAAEQYKMPWEVNIPKFGDMLGTNGQYEGLGYTHEVEDINEGVRCSSYKVLPTMQEKVEGQMNIAEKLRAVDEADVARLVIERHFMRDIKGNLRKFSMQQFRCVSCNEKFRRPPLIGRCTKCSGKIIFTVSEGTILKYLEPCISLAERYDLPPYLKQTIQLTKQRIESIFGRDKEKQEGLVKWFA